MELHVGMGIGGPEDVDETTIFLFGVDFLHFKVGFSHGHGGWVDGWMNRWMGWECTKGRGRGD